MLINRESSIDAAFKMIEKLPAALKYPGRYLAIYWESRRSSIGRSSILSKCVKVRLGLDYRDLNWKSGAATMIQ
jgi:hypothetical protein